MEKLYLHEIISAVRGSYGYPADVEISSVSTDTRTIKKGSVFIALKGERFDGHDFVAEAIKLGAVAAVTERAVEGARCIIVDSTGAALLDIAGYYRDKFNIELVGITGSVGKTTTKDFVSLVVSKKYKTLKTEGNHNNEIGLPLTLMNLDRTFKAAVIEMGMSHSGEISRLSQAAKPTAAIITNIGYSHIENLGSLENILKAKLEILDGAGENAPLILSKDDRLLRSLKHRGARKVLYYSIEDKSADVFASDISIEDNRIGFKINYRNEVFSAHINCIGRHNIKNALAAFCAGICLSVETSDIISAIAEFKPEGIRQNITKRNGISIIADCYNASPDSMLAAFDALEDFKSDGGKIAVLGDMLELGEMSKELHRIVGEKAASKRFDRIYTIGASSENIIKGAVKKGFKKENTAHFDSKTELLRALKSSLRSGDAVLFKASRGMKLEEVIQKL